MSSTRDRWKSPSWGFQEKADALFDLLDGVLSIATETLNFYVTSSATNSLLTALSIGRRVTGGDGAAGAGAALAFEVEDNAGSDIVVGKVDSTVTVATADEVSAEMNFSLIEAGTLAEKMTIGPTGLVTIVGVNDSGTTTLKDALLVGRNSTGTAAAGLGAGIAYRVEDDAGLNVTAGRVDVTATAATTTTVSAEMNFSLAEAGTVAEKMTIGPTGLVTINGVNNSTANSMLDALVVGRNTTGTGAAGLGAGIAYRVEDDAGLNVTAGRVDVTLTDASTTATHSEFNISLIEAGTLAEKVVVGPTGLVTINGVNNATANSMVDALVVGRNTTGTGAAGLGAGIAYRVENAAGANKIVGRADATLVTATGDAEDAEFNISVMEGGTLGERLTIAPTGVIDFKGTFGTSAVDPSETAESAWLEIKLNGTPYFVPLYVSGA
jgi:hypothetical protein